MRKVTTPPAIRFVCRVATLGASALALSGCALIHQSTVLPRPPLQLLESTEVELPMGCIATTSMRVAFTVETSGRTSEIQPSKGPACVQEALVSWVTSFRYAPRASRASTSVEWLLASDRRPVSMTVW